jgi:hypothetical protein
MMSDVRRWFPSLLLAAVATPAAAHDFFLLAEPPRAAAGAPIAIAMHVSDLFPGEAVPWRTGRIVDFFATDSKGRWDVTDAIVEGNPAKARVTLRSAGTTVFALSTDAAYIELKPEEFETYLKHEGHDTVLESRRRKGQAQAPGRERYTRHVKTVVNAAGPQASVALTRAGFPLEIVPETDLSRMRPGASLPVRVFTGSDPYVEAQICATYAGREGGHDTYAWCGKTDGAGRAQVPIAQPGWQMIRTTRIVPLRDDPKADWHSHWAALTFEAGPAPEKAPAPVAEPPGKSTPDGSGGSER